MTYTLQQLYDNGRDLVLRELITRAKRKEKVYYSQLAALLSFTAVDGKVPDQRVGWVVGSLMGEIWEWFPDAPPINMLVISKSKKVASKGADSFLRDYFGLRRMPSQARKMELADLAVNDVWDFSEWEEIYHGVAGANWSDTGQGGVQEFDDDGQGDNPKFGGLPESPEHRQLKQYVCANPSSVGLKQSPNTRQMESLLLSGDEMDVEFVFPKRRIGVEVKSRRSGEADLVRGVYQCVKYRAVLNAQYQVDGVRCDAYLATEQTLPLKILKLARRLKIKTYIVSPS